MQVRCLGHAGEHVFGKRQCLVGGQGLDGDGLEKAAQRRPDLHQPRKALGRRLAEDHEAPGGDRRDDLVEHGGALALMAAAHRHLHDIGDVPDRSVGAGQLVDHLANPALELADIDLIRLQIGAARFKDAPALVPETLR
jgi:hypothetical protein